jgi:hypothetical protein
VIGCASVVGPMALNSLRWLLVLAQALAVALLMSTRQRLPWRSPA